MPETFAIADPERPTRVSLWCRPSRGKTFDVLNGAWTGRLNDGLVEVVGSAAYAKRWPGVEVWRGEVPREHADDYNAAIAWIEGQLS